MVETPPTPSTSTKAAAGSIPGSGAAASATPCPGCGKGVDALRAGHVAIYDGLFLYYCDATCKALHLRAIASTLGDDVPTLDPPAVAERLVALAASEASSSNGKHAEHHANGRNGERSAPVPTLEVPTFLPAAPAATVSIEAPDDDAADTKVDLAPVLAPDVILVEHSSSSIVPRTLRSPLPAPMAERPAPPGVTLPPAERARRAVSVVGGAAGLLTLLLVIADVGLAVRLGLACIAAVALVARLFLSPRDAADANPLAAALPVLGALGAALVAYATEDAHADAITILAGVAASIAITAEEAVAWARDEVDAERARIGQALDVESRVLRGDGPSTMQRDVKAGEIVLVEEGGVVGVDGVVRGGSAVVVPWHAAPIEMAKGEGDAIVAGARVVSGRVRVVTAWAGGSGPGRGRSARGRCGPTSRLRWRAWRVLSSNGGRRPSPPWRPSRPSGAVAPADGWTPRRRRAPCGSRSGGAASSPRWPWSTRAPR